ncbi:PD-(D/E)XK motif protein [Pseudomonadales bacterium]|nr:PD-(D/E)XK motif protein [Pseudomonadales bacterium]
MSDISAEDVSDALQSKWYELNALGSRKRVLPAHPLKLYVGRSQAGNRIFQFGCEHDFKDFRHINFKSLQFHVDEIGQILSIELNDEGHASTYTAFLYDLVIQTSKMGKEHAPLHLIARLQDWSKLFQRSGKEGLTDSEALGLRGELQLVKWLLGKTKKQREVVEGWRGPNGDKSDIGWGTCRIEIKAKRATSKPNVSISSVDQLAENPGTLFLYVANLNSGAEDGLSITDLTDEINDLIGADLSTKHIFERKLMLVGYDTDDAACQTLFQDAGIQIYEVTDEFPKITTDMISSAISKVVYELELGQIQEYLVRKDRFWQKIGSSNE